MSQPSLIRDKAITVFQKLDVLSTKYIKHNTIRYFVEKFLRPRIENLIRFQIPEPELKQVMTEAFFEIKPIVEQFQVATQLKEMSKLNDPGMTKKLMKMPDFEKALSLIEDLP